MKTQSTRITSELVTLAEKDAEVARRNTPRQIELGAHLGRLLEANMNSADLHSLLSDQTFIAEVRLSRSVVPDADTVLSEL